MQVNPTRRGATQLLIARSTQDTRLRPSGVRGPRGGLTSPGGTRVAFESTARFPRSRTQLRLLRCDPPVGCSCWVFPATVPVLSRRLVAASCVSFPKTQTWGRSRADGGDWAGQSGPATGGGSGWAHCGSVRGLLSP